MYEFSYRGAQVMNDKSILTAKKYGVAVEVMSSMLNKTKGTIIKANAAKTNACSGIAIINNVTKLILTNAQSHKELIDRLTESGINVDKQLKSVGQNKNDSFTIAIPENRLQEAMEVINNFSAKSDESQIFYEKGKSKISVINISENININIASIIFEILSEAKINIEMVACDNKRVSILLPTTHMSDAVNIIHSKLFEEDTLI